MDADLITAIGQAAGISGVVTAVLWTKLRGLCNRLGDVDKSIVGLRDSVGELDKTTAVGNERLDQIEGRLDGNGKSVPARCGIHSAKLVELERRISTFE